MTAHFSQRRRPAGRKVHIALAAVLLIATLCGCQRPEGPAERAGKEVDKAVEQAGQQIEKAGEKLQDATQGNRK
mgnify:CR=1 FL=1|jgi:hypothetical protein